MEELVKKFIDSLIEQAKTEAAKLAKQKESEGHITVPATFGGIRRMVRSRIS